MPILHAQTLAQAQRANGTLVQIPASAGLQQRGPCVQVSITLEQTVAQALVQRGEQLPSPVAGLALIDTGASVTCIDAQAARHLGLTAINVVPMASASQARTDKNVYSIQFEIVGFPIRLQSFNAIEAELATQGLVLLIGRDALQVSAFFYNGPAGEFTLCI